MHDLSSYRCPSRGGRLVVAAFWAAVIACAPASALPPSGIRGALTYTGSLGPVSGTRPLCLCVYADANLQTSLGCYIYVLNGVQYDIPTFDMNDYFLVAFLDILRNETVDRGEPYEIYRDRAAPPADAVTAGPATSADLTFGDENLAFTPTPSATPATPTANGSPTPTPTAGDMCIGDCDGSGTVTVDEIVTMVQIALGTAPISACAAACCRPGEACLDDGASVTVDCVLAAVNHALTGCEAAPGGLRAAVHFEREREPINTQLIGTGGTAPLADITGLLATSVRPAWIRLDVGFEDVGCPDNPDAGPLYDAAANSFDYCQLDRRLEQARATGAAPLLIIDYTPPALADPACAATNGGGLGTQHCPPADYTKYGALVEAMIRHVYTTFGVTDYEVWNEPDGIFFAGRFSDYLQIYETSNAAVERAEGALGLPRGALRLGGPAATLASRSWISRLLTAAIQNPALRVDFISWHNYANSPFVAPPDPLLYAGTYANDTETVRGWLAPFQAQRPDLAPLLWIDEWNVNALFDPRMDTSYDTAFMAAALHGMQDAGLDRAARFNTWDSSPASPEGNNGNWGLFTHEGEVRPAFHAFALWRQMAPTRVTVELLDDASRTRDASVRTRYRRNLIASVDTAGRRATLLLYDFVPYSLSDTSPPYCGGGQEQDAGAMLELYGLPDGEYQLTRQQVDCSTAISPVDAATLQATRSTLSVSGQHASLDIAVPPDGVVLLTLTLAPAASAARR